jgi:tetratricopeptide (TPR) repeat protein
MVRPKKNRSTTKTRPSVKAMDARQPLEPSPANSPDEAWPLQSAVMLSPTRQNAALCLLLAAATVVLYSSIVRHPFVNYDDGAYVYNNPHVNSGISWENIRWSVTAIAEGNWHPITWISHALDWQLFGHKAGGHHLTSLLLHVVNVVLLFLLLLRATGAMWRSFVVAALFGVHPFNVESVAWVAERKNVLCTLFLLLTLGAYGWYSQRPNRLRYFAVGAFFLLGLASKPMVITLPFILLLIDYWPLGRIQNWSTPSAAFPIRQFRLSHLALEKLPLLAMSAASAVLTVVAQRRANAIAPDSTWGLTLRLENAIHGYTTYLWKTFCPSGLAPFYPGMVLESRQVWLAAFFLLAVCLLIIGLRLGRPFLISGFLWFMGALVPVIGIVQVGAQSMADRYAYIPLIGIFVAVVWGIWDAAEHRKIRMQWVIASFVVVLAILSAVTRRQLEYWRSSSILWSHALQVTPSNYVAELNLAVSLTDQGKDDEALPHFEKVKEIRPDDVVALLNIGSYLMKHGNPRQAIEEFQIVVSTHDDPDQLTAAYRYLGAAYVQLGDRHKARENFLAAMRLSPEDPTEFYNLSMLEVEDGVDKLSKVVSAHPTAKGYLDLAQLLQQDRKPVAAKVAYQKALELDPKLAEARQALDDLHTNR